MKSKIPLSVTLLTMTVLFFTAWNGLRLFETIVNWEILIKFDAQPGPIYMAIFSLVWCLAGLVAFLGLLRGNYYLWMFMIKLITILYTIWYWVDRLLFQKTNIYFLFPIVFTIIMILFITTIFNHRNTQNYFKQRETHDRIQ